MERPAQGEPSSRERLHVTARSIGCSGNTRRRRPILRRFRLGRGLTTNGSCRSYATPSVKRTTDWRTADHERFHHEPLIRSTTRSSTARTGSDTAGRKSGRALPKGVAHHASVTPELFDKKHPKPWNDFTLKSRTKTKKHAVTREEVYKFAWAASRRDGLTPRQSPSSALSGYNGPRTWWPGF